MVGLPIRPYTRYYAMYEPGGSFRLTTKGRRVVSQGGGVRAGGIVSKHAQTCPQKRVRNIDKRIPVRNCEEIRGLTVS
jgi:hypothetical protein